MHTLLLLNYVLCDNTITCINTFSFSNKICMFNLWLGWQKPGILSHSYLQIISLSNFLSLVEKQANLFIIIKENHEIVKRYNLWWYSEFCCSGHIYFRGFKLTVQYCCSNVHDFIAYLPVVITTIKCVLLVNFKCS